MRYTQIDNRLRDGGIVILDGGTGTELQRRGAVMDTTAWCGPASLHNTAVLQAIHTDYISAGADIITTNTFSTSRMLLRHAGLGERFEEVNRCAIDAALRAREASGRNDILVAGSVSHMVPPLAGTMAPDPARGPSASEMAESFEELANFLRGEGCDLIVLEMMFAPERLEPAFKAATGTGLPVWAGLSARRGDDGSLLSFAQQREIPFSDIVAILNDFDVAAAGIMHTRADAISEAIDGLRKVHTGPLTAYPDSGYMKMPNWQFEEIMSPQELLRFATDWIDQGVQVIGGCCGLSPDHIAALKPLKTRSIHASS